MSSLFFSVLPVLFHALRSRRGDPSRCLIVGAGVAGLGVGWKLAQAGLDVLTLEAGEPLRGATWASAGMLAPHMELRPEEEEISRFGVACLERWPKFAQELEAASGISVDYRKEGTLCVAVDRAAAAQLQFLYRHQQETGLQTEWLSGPEVRERFGGLSHRVVAGIFSPHDHQVDPRRLGEALLGAYLRAGGRLRTHAPVQAIEVEDGRAVGVRLKGSGERIEADCVVLAGGAWSGLIEGVPPLARPPVQPVRGQILVLRQPEPPLLETVVWVLSEREFAYLAPKSSGHILLGATVEEMGFDVSVTAGGLMQLLRPAWEAVPGIEDLAVVEVLAGLRPGSRDGAPILGPTPVPGLYLATGQFRNGILFAPTVAEDVAQAILTGRTPETLQPFLVERFYRGGGR